MREKKLIRPFPRWKIAVGLVAAFAVLFAATLLFARLVMPSTRPQPLTWSKEEIAAAHAVRTHPAQLEHPRVTLPITAADYRRIADWQHLHPGATPETVTRAIAAGELPAWYPRQQSPLLDSLDKPLPPVAERVGPEPIVMRGCDGMGEYGGVWVQFVAGSTTEAEAVVSRISNSKLFRFSPNGRPIVPHVAKGYEMKDGGRVWEIELRKIRWSDGTPLTTDDVEYFWKWEMTNKTLGGSNPWRHFTIGGQSATFEKLSPHKFRLTYPEPRGDVIEVLCYNNMLTPAHFARQYHPDLGDPKFIESEMKRLNATNVRSLYSLVNNAGNPEKPSLNPWIYRKYTTMSPLTFVRNPYYFAVDEAGRQLPYIDRIQCELIEAMMLPLAVSNGRADFQFRYIRFENYTEFAGRAKDNGFQLKGWIPGTRSEWLLYPNLNRLTPADEPETPLKAKLLADVDFRRGLSLAIDRKTAIEAIYSGCATPEQVDPGPYSEFASEKLRHAYTQFDPAAANKHLDAAWRRAGLDPDRRKDGYRCDAKGNIVNFYLIFTDFTGLGPAQFVVDDWKKVGVRAIYQQCSRPLFSVKAASRNFDFYIWTSESEMEPLLSPRTMVSASSESAFAIGWGNWAARNGYFGDAKGNTPGCIPIPKDHPMYQSLGYYEQALRSINRQDQIELLRKITDIAADNVWTINVGCAPPKLLVVSDNMKNIPDKATEGYYYYSPSHIGLETCYFLQPNRSADADTLDQLNQITPMPSINGVKASAGSLLLTSLGVGIGLLLVVLLILRHPFILRRLLIMIPTLFVISMAIFTIVQLPPGDFLSNRLLQLQESGVEQERIDVLVEDLRQLHHFDDPVWKRYCRWIGFTYFVTFDSRDQGLLQGNMGYSMETGRSVNSMVGDRIWLTILISLGTVILTWSLALPIGIYSACRQYSFGDYVFSVVGFLGMCIPSFLLALILMALTGISGLFSAQYAVQPYWDWAKFADMMRHIWLPILVVGVAGTAGMIRVMRANLLDELGKPYVTTARAKGVPPMRLLFKYPVRLALNPFISGIGSLFPALVSGSSIVAIVMSLPTVGPLMLAALFSQDMNMAGSMLMVLSLLGVFGTLVSDLLLMAVDPRIRIGGGKAK